MAKCAPNKDHLKVLTAMRPTSAGSRHPVAAEATTHPNNRVAVTGHKADAVELLSAQQDNTAGAVHHHRFLDRRLAMERQRVVISTTKAP